MENIKNILSKTSGYKTYLTSAAGALVLVGFLTHLIQGETASMLLWFLGFGSAASLRSALSTIEQNQAELGAKLGAISNTAN